MLSVFWGAPVERRNGEGMGNALSILVVPLVSTRMSMGRGDALSGVPSKLGIVKG